MHHGKQPKDDMGRIYAIHSPSRKQYIGQTKLPLTVRMCQHRLHAQKAGKGAYKDKCRALCASINKYGWNAMSVELVHDNVPVDQLNELEVQAIKERGSLAPGGYNLHSGGEHYAVSESTRERLREVWKRPGVKDRQRESASATFKSLWSSRTPEERQAAMANNKVAINSEQGRANRRASQGSEAANTKRRETWAKKREERLALLSPEKRAKELQKLMRSALRTTKRNAERDGKDRTKAMEQIREMYSVPAGR